VTIEDGEFCVLVGPSRLRQEHAAAHDRRAWRRSPGGEIRIGNRVVNQVAPKERGHRDGVPELRALPAHDGCTTTMAFSLKLAGPAGGKKCAAGRTRRRRSSGLNGVSRALSAPALGRPSAPARRHGARAIVRKPQVFLFRRAALQPRRQAARGDAHRDQGAAPAADHDRDLCHARPDRGDDDGRQDRRHERRARSSRSARRSSSTTIPPTCSSPASSARRPMNFLPEEAQRPATCWSAMRPEHLEIAGDARAPANLSAEVVVGRARPAPTRTSSARSAASTSPRWCASATTSIRARRYVSSPSSPICFDPSSGARLA